MSKGKRDVKGSEVTALVPILRKKESTQVKKGRPTKMNIDSMRPIIESCARQGMTDVQIAIRLGVCTDSLYEWSKKSKDFALLMKYAKELAQDHWLKLFNDNMIFTQGKDNTKLDTIGWIFNMKNRFNWRDKTELSSDKDSPLIVNLDVKASKV